MLRSVALRASRRVRPVLLATGLGCLQGCTPAEGLCVWLQGLALAQQQRGFADKAVATEFNWDAMTDLIHSDEGKRELQTLRLTYLDISQRLRSLAQVRAVRPLPGPRGPAPAVWELHRASSTAPAPTPSSQSDVKVDWAAASKELDPSLVSGFKTALESERRHTGSAAPWPLHWRSAPAMQQRARRAPAARVDTHTLTRTHSR